MGKFRSVEMIVLLAPLHGAGAGMVTYMTG
jgi:hypothetical protein